MWYTNGPITDPAANAILAETPGEGETATHEADIYMSSTVNCELIMEWRDATNTSNLFSHMFPIAANSTVLFTGRGNYEMQAGQRIRVRQNSGVTGKVQASINFL